VVCVVQVGQRDHFVEGGGAAVEVVALEREACGHGVVLRALQGDVGEDDERVVLENDGGVDVLHHGLEHVCGRGQHFVDGLRFSSFGGKSFLSYFFGFIFLKI